MCGIFACINCKYSIEFIQEYYNKIKHRGPDASVLTEIDVNVIFGFHRLAIVDTSENGMQPFSHNGVHMICNGEIFNHLQLEEEHNLNPEMHSRCDCECILHMYEHYDIETVVKSLDAEFACIIYDSNKKQIHVARDQFGVRPLFIGGTNNNGLYFASEAKAINFCEHVKQFPPGHYLTINLLEGKFDITYKKFYEFPQYKLSLPYDDILAGIRGYFIEAVKKRTMSDRTVGCLLSGGLDSSLVASVLCKFMPEIHFYSIGLKDSVDVKAAKRVIEYLKIPKTHHHIKEFTVEEGLDILEEVIEQLETYDVTTIRASVPQYILAKYISQHTPVIVLYSGEGSDELVAGYQYSKQAPNSFELDQDSKNLLTELAWFDNLRTDRTTAKWGLEVRVPFLDKKLVHYIMSLDPGLKMCNDKIEKKLLRDAFKGWLPDDILYRPKEAFSDAVSSKEVSWYRSLQALINKEINDIDLVNQPYKHNPPLTKEALYYRRIFDKYYPDRNTIIPKYWMPKWQSKDLTDPSATVLKCHTGDLSTK